MGIASRKVLCTLGHLVLEGVPLRVSYLCAQGVCLSDCSGLVEKVVPIGVVGMVFRPGVHVVNVEIAYVVLMLSSKLRQRTSWC